MSLKDTLKSYQAFLRCLAHPCLGVRFLNTSSSRARCPDSIAAEPSVIADAQIPFTLSLAVFDLTPIMGFLVPAKRLWICLFVFACFSHKCLDMLCS